MNQAFKITGFVAALMVAAPSFAENLAGSEWQPVWLDGADYTPIQETFVGFDQDGRYAGSAGCNRIMGGFVTNEDAILLGPAAATMMACPSDIAEQEHSFIAALMSTRFFKRDGITLTLSDSAGALVLKMQQRDAD
ncbi:MAG: META domain-containing protein [Roseobacter sp.]